MVDRRNDPVFWTGRISWTRLKLKTLPSCDDCLINVHAAGGTDGRVPRARWRRKNAVGGGSLEAFQTTNLCDTHRQDWQDWTPGQMALGS